MADEEQGEAQGVPSRLSAESPPVQRARAEPTPSISVQRSAAALPRRDTLDLEIALLHSVDDALARRDTGRAKSLLNQHRARFGRPALLEEREGFRALVRCMERTPDATLTAKRFAARFPQSILASRVQHECAVEEQHR